MQLFVSFHSKPLGLWILTRNEDGWGMSTVKGIWKPGELFAMLDPKDIIQVSHPAAFPDERN